MTAALIGNYFFVKNSTFYDFRSISSKLLLQIFCEKCHTFVLSWSFVHPRQNSLYKLCKCRQNELEQINLLIMRFKALYHDRCLTRLVRMTDYLRNMMMAGWLVDWLVWASFNYTYDYRHKLSVTLFVIKGYYEYLLQNNNFSLIYNAVDDNDIQLKTSHP
jgi:hypothetical protein